MDLTQQTTSSVITKGDETRVVPTTILTASEASLLGEYESYLSRERLTRTLRCRTCGPETDVEVSIEPAHIGLMCGHRLLFYAGPVPVVRVDYPEAGEPVTIVRVVTPETRIATADAFMLRNYQKLLRKYELQEALYCLKCEDEGQPSGLHAYVTVSEMALICRCQARIFRGLTI